MQFDGFRVIYGCVTGFLWLVTSIFSPEYLAQSPNRKRYWLFNLLTLGTVLGVFFSADFRTAFIFFEIMSISSYAMVAHDESPTALRAAGTYLAVAIIGGLAQFMGILLLQQRAGTLEFARLYEISMGLQDKSKFYLPGILLIAGFGAKAGMFPLHIWLPKAHSIAPAPASALLSGILTKTGVFGVAAVSCNLFFQDYRWSAGLLIPAAITMVLGAVLGVFSNDLKRTLACSSISQIGIILTGVAMQGLLGEHNTLAIRGTLLHMLNHSLIKLALFVAAGVVYMNLHTLELNKIRGFGRGKPLFLFVFLMGMLGICGVPLWNGYVSKTLLHEGIVEGIHLYHGLPLEFPLQLLNASFMLTGALTVVYMVKLFVVLFLEQSGTSTEKRRYISRPSAVALAVSAALLPLLGCFPVLMDKLADWGQDFFNGYYPGFAPDHGVHYFAWENIRSVVITLAAGITIYFFVVRGLMMRIKDGAKIYISLWPEWLDLENLFYRPLLKNLIRIGTFFVYTITILPGKFLSQHYQTIQQHLQSLQKEPGMIRYFSLDLLLVSAGTGIAIVFAFIQAFR